MVCNGYRLDACNFCIKHYSLFFGGGMSICASTWQTMKSSLQKKVSVMLLWTNQHMMRLRSAPRQNLISKHGAAEREMHACLNRLMPSSRSSDNNESYRVTTIDGFKSSSMDNNGSSSPQIQCS